MFSYKCTTEACIHLFQSRPHTLFTAGTACEMAKETRGWDVTKQTIYATRQEDFPIGQPMFLFVLNVHNEYYKLVSCTDFKKKLKVCTSKKNVEEGAGTT